MFADICVICIESEESEGNKVGKIVTPRDEDAPASTAELPS